MDETKTQSSRSSSGNPLITALMITKGDPTLVSRSYKCFTQQTYPNKSLLIVTNGKFRLTNTADMVKDHRVKVLHVHDDLSLGELRNISIQTADSDLSLQLDDDDYSGPDRMSQQYAALGDKRAVLMTDQLHYFEALNKVAWVTDMSGIEGTLLLDRRSNARYPSLPRREDTELKRKLAKKNWINLTVGGIQYCRVYTGANTWDLEHHLARVRRMGKSREELQSVIHQLHIAAKLYGWKSGWELFPSDS